ncbi:MAG: TIGR03088 family PEP-CTERM/XrtA system glycosyltransferase [Burkholderiales bacterium]|nr:TIGR03088 family PEP-CTERM/XrtA system glycosyltransferase [Burkholderiales bacterium]
MENGLVNLINAMPADRYRHAIACVEGYTAFRERIRRPGVDVVALERSRVGVWRLRRELYALCRRLRPAIVHSRNMSGLDAVVPAMLAGVRHRVHGEHGWDVGDLRGERLKPMLLRRAHAPFISRYITVSADLSRYLQARVGVAAAKISHICNGVDTARFSPGNDATRRDILPAGFCDAHSIVIGTVGRIQAVKDQRLLLEAFAAARQAQPALRDRLRLAVVGDGPLLNDLHQQAARLGISDATWLPGARDDIPAVLRALDLFVLPSLNEGISNTILEAFASGLPVVATGVGGNPELIDDGMTGRLFAPGDVEFVTRAITDYASDAGLRKTQGNTARQGALERFSLEAMVSQYQAVYDRLVSP